MLRPVPFAGGVARVNSSIWVSTSTKRFDNAATSRCRSAGVNVGIDTVVQGLQRGQAAVIGGVSQAHVDLDVENTSGGDMRRTRCGAGVPGEG